MAFVLDCSLTMAWLFPDEATEATDRLRESLLEEPFFTFMSDAFSDNRRSPHRAARRPSNGSRRVTVR